MHRGLIFLLKYIRKIIIMWRLFQMKMNKTNKGGHIPVTAFGIIMTRRPRL